MTTAAATTLAKLAAFEVLRGVGAELLVTLIERCETCVLEPGQRLIERGDPNSRMYIVLDGMLRVDVKDAELEPLARLGVGETVGELSLLGRSAASAHVTAEAATSLLALDEDVFYWLIGASHAFSVRLLTRLAERLRNNNETVEANIALRRQFEQAALHDALTGAQSRRWLQETLPRLVQRHASSAEPLAVAVLDVDHFKRVNDTFGHPAGDAVLMALGRLIRERLRPTDFVARFGGEEFVLIFPNTPLWGGLRAAERLREAIAACAVEYNGAPLPAITVSIGVAALTASSNAERLLAEADQALYRAKQLGRNQSQCFTPPEA